MMIPGIYPEWKRVVEQHRVLGVKVYDARLVAVMNLYGVDTILTFNTGDFKRPASLCDDYLGFQLRPDPLPRIASEGFCLCQVRLSRPRSPTVEYGDRGFDEMSCQALAGSESRMFSAGGTMNTGWKKLPPEVG